MKFEVTAREIGKTTEMRHMFGIPDMDVETSREALESRHEHWSDWKFSLMYTSGFTSLLAVMA